MRPKGSAAELEVRRRLAVRMLSQGVSPSEVAELVGANLSSVKRWKAAWQKGGDAALAAKPHPGRPPRLTTAQKRQLERILLRGPRAAGLGSDLWTCRRVAETIRRTFGVSYHVDHVWRILQSLGWSCQKPELRARERDEAAIERWRTRDWPRIKKELSAAS
jgi:transposase